MKKITFLFALLCASVMGFAIDWSGYDWIGVESPALNAYANKFKTDHSYVNIQQRTAGAGIYMTFPAGISSCSLGDGNYEVQGAGMWLFVSAFTAQETPVHVVDGLGEYDFTVYYADGATSGGGDPDPGTDPEPTPGEKFVPANASITSYFANWEWAQEYNSTASYDDGTGEISVHIDNNKNIQWYAQVKLALGFSFVADKYYDFSIKFHANQAVPQVTLKASDDIAMFYEDQSVNLPADEDFVWTKSDVLGKAGNNIFVFDFGHASANSNITISEISIIEKDEPSTPPTPVDPNDYTAGGHTIHLDASYVGDIYTLVITSTDDMEGLSGSYWNVNGVGGNRLSDVQVVSGDKKTITCQVQSTSAPNIYTPLYIFMPGEVNFGDVTLNWEDRTPINSEYCNYQGSETHQNDHYYAITWETDPSGNVVITIGNGTGAGACSFRNGGFEGGNNGLANFVVSDDDFATTTPATDYFTVTRPSDGDLEYVMTKIADLPDGAKIKHLSAGAIAWREAGADRWCFPEFIYTYGGTCNQLDAPTNVSIDANNILTFDAVSGADSYMAYVSLGGVEKYSQAVASGDELTFTPLIDGDYDVTVVASGTGKTDSDPSSAFVWSLTAAPVVLGNSEYCEHVFMADDNREAAFTWETDGDGNIVITISATRGDAAATHFRGNGMALANFKVGAGKEDASTYFNHACGGSNQVTLSLKNPANAPALGEKIYFNNTVEYATSLEGNAWPTLNFEWTYGTVCSGKSVSASVNNNTMGSAVVQKAGVDVTNVDEGDEVSFIATSADPALYRFVNWTKGGVEVSTSTTYVTTITESTNLIANFDYIRNTYCHSEITSIQGKKLFMTLGAIGGGQYQIKFEGSAEAPLTALTNANYTINWVTTDIVDGDKPMSGQDVPFANARWAFDASGYGSATAVFGISEGKTWEDIYVWNHAIYFMTDEGEVGYTGFPGRYHIAWNETCSDTEAPVFAKAQGAVIDATSVRLTIQASDNWEGMLQYTIARADAEPIISNHASGEEFTQDVTGLTTGTEYDFTVTVSDGVNNANTHILVTPVADNTKPYNVDASLVSKTWNAAVISVAADDDFDAEITKFRVVNETPAINLVYVASEGKITVTDLVANTDYNFTITALDAADNESELGASVAFKTLLAAPDAACENPTLPSNQVKAVYSPTYGVDCNFGYWDSGTAYTQEAYGKKFVTTGTGYFGLEFINHLNCINMEKLHLDIWIAENASIGIVPIWGGGDVRAYADLTGQQWNSIDLELSTDYAGVANWSDVYQLKIDNAANLTFWIANAYFYRESAIVDTEAPTNVSASATASFYSFKITAQAEDNSGAVNFKVLNGTDILATGAAATGVATTIAVNNLTPGTAYNLNVVAYDDANNEAAPVEVVAATKALPAAAPAPTHEAKAVKSIYSEAYTPAIPTGINFNEAWWQAPTVAQEVSLGGNNARYYGGLNTNGVFGITWSGDHKLDAAGYQKVHFHIYPTNSATIEIYPVIQPEGEFHKVSQELVGGQWNEVVIDYSDKTFAPFNQFGVVYTNALGDFFIDNLYFYSDPDYTRDVTDGNYGTICLPQAGEIVGATLYEIADYANNMIYVDEVEGGVMAAGKPYIFQATSDKLNVYYTSATVAETAGVANGLHGFYNLTNSTATLTLEDNASLGNYILYQNQYWLVSGRAATIANYRAYIKISEINYVAPAPGIRRVAMQVNGQNTTTGVDNLNAGETPVKMVINGQLFILRGEKMYDTTGRLVK